MFYFDTLPIHFPPKRLESLSSYLARLARANLLTEPCQMNYLLKPGRKDERYIQKMEDYPPVTIEDMVRCTGQSSETLLSTTFYPIAVNLGRNPHPQAISRFLKGSIVGHLRYCPKCLEEAPYYRLPWRFVSLKICPEHACMIQERCPACGKPLPLVAPGFQVNVCASCGQILANSSIELARSQNDIHANQLLFNELLGLLSMPTPLPEIKQQAASLGCALKRARLNLGYSLSHVSVQTGIEVSALAALEASRMMGSRGTFQQLKAYAGLLGTTITLLLANEKPGKDQLLLTAQGACEDDWQRAFIKPKTKVRKINRVEDLPAKIDEAIEALRLSGDPITRQNVCKYIGIKGLIDHGDPKIIALLKKIQKERAKQARQAKQEEEKYLLPAAKQAIAAIVESEGYLHLPTFCKAMGKSLKQLRKYPKIARLIDLQKIEERSHYKEVAPEDLIKTIEDLKAANQPVSQVSIAKALEVSTSFLRKRPEFRRTLDNYGLVRQQPESNIQNSLAV